MYSLPKNMKKSANQKSPLGKEYIRIHLCLGQQIGPKYISHDIMTYNKLKMHVVVIVMWLVGISNTAPHD